MTKCIKWTKEENRTLREVYPLGNKDSICKALPNRSWEGIKIHAAILKIRMIHNPHITTKLYKLLEDTHEAYYWMGLIAADGCFFGKYTRLTITLCKKDINHLKKYSNYVESLLTERKTTCSVSSQDKYLSCKIMDKFDLHERKTYNPPKTIKWMRPELALSFLIGFIDGDGHIKATKRTMCKIKIHSSWLHILNEFSDLVKNQFKLHTPNAYILKSGYANMDICEFEILKKLKQHAIKNNLPCLERKWNRIDENKIGFYEKSRERIKECYKLKKLGYRNKDIAEKIGVDDSRVSEILSNIKDGKYIFNNKFAPIELEREVIYEVWTNLF